jgi:conjugative relaxase-like TrwC/TraI family protein
MVSIGKLGAGQERYYLDKVGEGAEDYYSGEGEAEGQWFGDAAEDLGLYGTVEGDQLVAMLTGNNPATGEPLGLRQVSGRGPVPGFDVTFSAPKSVSLLWALGGEEVGAEARAAHTASVEAALDYLQREACWTRRGAGGHEFVHGNGFLAAGYLHRSSRAGDPQLHTHVLIANATKGPDGRWTRLYHPAIYDHAKTASYIYEAHLRHEMSQRLGVRWQEVRRGIAEVDGFADAHLREFSTRRREILEAAGADASARARQVANLTTRKGKERDLTDESLRERWRSKAQEIGLSAEVLEATTAREPSSAPRMVSIEEVDRTVTASASHFDRRDAVQAVAQCLPSGAPAHEVESMADAFLVSDAVIRIGESPKGERFTTLRIWELERRALASAEEMVAASDRAVAGELIAARVISTRPTLKADQRAMVKRLLEGGEGLSIVVGEAGTGKTYATLAVAEGWAAAGVGLRVAAPTWRAANVLRSEGLEATSIARLLVEFDRAEAEGRIPLAQGSVLLIDEAGMVDSATTARLIDHAQAAEAKLVLIGDPEQLGEIEAGGLFRSLAERSEPVVLDEVIRHNHKLDREAAQRIRSGEGREALSLYRSEERVVMAPDPEARREAMVADWWQSFAEGEDALMVAKRNAEVAKLNELAREVMRAEGRLGSVEIEVGEGRFAVGDQVITRINDHKAEIYNRERWRVAEVDPEAQTVALDGIDTARRVCVDSVYLEARTRDDAPALQHAYAATTYQAQGATVDRAYVMADPSMDKQELYVATSRSREQTYLYAIPEIQIEREEFAPRSPHLREGLDHIAEAAERDGAQVSAHDEALRSALGGLSTDELVARRNSLRPQAGAEARRERAVNELEQRIAGHVDFLGGLDTQRERLSAMPRKLRRSESERIEQAEAQTRESLARRESEARELAGVEYKARAELAVIEHLIAERQRLAVAAVRISPPPYIVQELGERPADPIKREAWDRAVRRVEGYRRENGIKDRDNALGAQPEGRSRQRHWEHQQSQLRRSQQALERVRAAGRVKGLGIEL